MSVKSKINKNWSSQLLKDINTGLAELITEVDRRAKILAPVDTRALVNSARIRIIGAFAYGLSFGSPVVPYARIHELGGYAGRNHATHIRPKRYLERAAESVMRGDTGKYFRGKIQ